MSLLIPNFHSNSDVVVENAYMRLNYFNYDFDNRRLNFAFSIWASPDAYRNRRAPLETGFSGTLPLEYYMGENLVDLIETALVNKVSLVVGKTASECEAHNNELNLYDSDELWADRWDYDYTRLVNLTRDESLPWEGEEQ